jgi:hypothetical protein
VDTVREMYDKNLIDKKFLEIIRSDSNEGIREFSSNIVMVNQLYAKLRSYYAKNLSTDEDGSVELVKRIFDGDVL